METYIAAMDQGTTSSRAILFNRAGEIVSRAQYPFRQIYPQPGWVEHDPVELWNMEKKALAEAVDAAHIDPKQIAALGITTQRETTVLWERATGQPVYNAIVWQCRRTAAICDRLKADGWSEAVTDKTGLLIDAYFSGTKIKWILDNVPGVRQRAERGELCAGTVDSWLIWNLTAGKVHVTDYSNASRTMLFNIHTLQWDEDLCRALDIPMSLLPQPRPNSEGYGTVAGGDPRPGVSCGHSYLRQRRRPARRPVRPGLLPAGPGEKYIRHRLLYPDERGRTGGALPGGAGDLRGLVRGRKADLRSGGQRVQRRQHHPVAAG